MSTIRFEEDPPEIGEATDMTRLDHIPTTLHNLPHGTMPRTITYRKRKSFPAGYKPGDFDICCGRGKRHWNHTGNVKFRRLIQSNVERYMDAPSKNDKTAVVVSIVDDIRQMGGCFLKEDLRGNWYDIGDQQAREKVGHSLRDQVSTIHRQKRKHLAMKNNNSHNNNPTASQLEQQTTNFIQNNLLIPAPLLNPAAEVAPATNTNNNYDSMSNSQQQPALPQPVLNSVTSGMSSINASLSGSMIAALEATQNIEVPEFSPYFEEEEDDGALSDGSNERTVRRSTLSSSMIIDKFARRPSFASAVADPMTTAENFNSNSFSTRQSSKRSSGWSFLNELDIVTMQQWDAEFLQDTNVGSSITTTNSLEPIQYKSV